MIEITDLEHLINDNKKMINMFDTFKNKIISQNEILLKVLDDYESYKLGDNKKEDVSTEEISSDEPKLKKNSKNKKSSLEKQKEEVKDSTEEEEEVEEEEEPVKLKKDKKKNKLKKITKTNSKAIDIIKNKLQDGGKENVEVELIKIEKKSYYVAEDGTVYNKKAEIIGKYNFDEETIVLE